MIHDCGLSTVTFGLATAALATYGEDSPEFIGPATVWAYQLPEFGGSVVEAERAIQEEHESHLDENPLATRGDALRCMMFS